MSPFPPNCCVQTISPFPRCLVCPSRSFREKSRAAAGPLGLPQEQFYFASADHSEMRCCRVKGGGESLSLCADTWGEGLGLVLDFCSPSDHVWRGRVLGDERVRRVVGRPLFRNVKRLLLGGRSFAKKRRERKKREKSKAILALVLLVVFWAPHFFLFCFLCKPPVRVPSPFIRPCIRHFFAYVVLCRIRENQKKRRGKMKTTDRCAS